MTKNLYICTMKVVFAFDSFKGCITAHEACAAAAQAAHEVCPTAQIVQLPLSDGGEGLVACISRLLPVQFVSLQVHGPLMEPVQATYALSPDGQTAYIEMAAAAGLTLVPSDRRNPLLTTTYGVGEMLLDAIGRGCQHIIMGIGGSATCDGGAGMIQCLTRAGYFAADDNAQNHTVAQPQNHAATQPQNVTTPHPHTHITVACDVTNPLYGPNGAAYVFGPQKGATPQQVELLDQRLRDFERQTIALGRATPAHANVPGAGAAGGLGYSLLTYLGATLRSGIDIVLDLLHFDQQVADADFVFTGEGKSDAQTLMGKVPMGVLHRTPAHLLSGAIDDRQALLDAGFLTVRSINEHDPRPLSQLLQPAVAIHNLQQSVRQALRTLTSH